MLTPELLGRALGDAPDPELARVALSRVGERRAARELLERPEIIPSAGRLLGFSRSAADFFLAHPDELACLADTHSRTLDELVPEAADLIAERGTSAGLRVFRRRAWYRVAARDLAGADVEDVMAELSAAAVACVREATAAAASSDGLSVIGMGKLGGVELNYSSDVDVLFVHRSVGAESQRAAARAAAEVVSLLAETTVEGAALRVDTDLRPEGRAGPLSRSLDSMVEYYGRHAATWERQALLKARPVAGDRTLGIRFVDAISPFVYPRVLPPSTIEDVRSSKARIEDHVRAVGKDAIELKRGRGGIRDVEFAVQLLQLVHGRRYQQLREPNTLRALAALAAEGFVGEADAHLLADSYRFLRRLEHRVQMVRDLQTHDLPSDRAALTMLARSVGLADATSLLAEHARHTQTVRTLHERLFYRPLLEAFAGPSPRPAVDMTATTELLRGLGFADAAGAYRRFARVVDPSTRLGAVLGTLFPVVAPAVAFASWPDAALVRFERVVSAAAGRPEVGELPDRLADRPDAARRLASLVGASSAFADALASRPDLVAALLEPPTAQALLFPVDPRAELVRVAGAFASGEVRVPDVGRRLAAVAEGAIRGALHDEASPVPLAVVGVGRLGAEELSFASDLDLLFVYEGEGHADFLAAGRTAERVLGRLRDEGWQPDADLRPEGRSGPLARSMASYLEYWQRWAETWEYQALLRARHVAGDEVLGYRFVSNASDVAFPERLTFEQLASIRRMRVRMEEERVRPKDARQIHVKLGHGSLADVQFAVELSLMRHGFEHPEVRRTHTLEALEALTAADLLNQDVSSALAEGFVFLSEVKNAIEIEHRRPAGALPPTPEGQTALARRLGYGARARHAFLQEYRRVTRRVRRAMERVFYPEEDDR